MYTPPKTNKENIWNLEYTAKDKSQLIVNTKDALAITNASIFIIFFFFNLV